MLKFVRAIVVPVAVLALGVASCGDDGGDPTGSDVGRIEATVRADGSGESGVTVRLFASGGTAALGQATTNTSGVATFANLDPGGYDVEVEVPAELELAPDETDRRAVTVTAGGTASVTFDLVAVIAGEVVEITLSGVTFTPSDVTIAPGTTVRWRNAQAVGHTITPDGHSEWNRQTMTNEGQIFLHTFDAAGTFPYFCEPHLSQGMTGTIRVQ